MIERFILPERKARPVEDPVGGSCRRPFQPAHYLRNGNLRSDEDMDMVGHNHPGREFVKVPFALTNQDGFRNEIGNRGILQPDRPGCTSCQHPVRCHEGLTGGEIYRAGVFSGKRPPQPPGNKYPGIFRLKVRQSPPIFRHRYLAQAKPPAPPYSRSGHRNFSPECPNSRRGLYPRRAASPPYRCRFLDAGRAN